MNFSKLFRRTEIQPDCISVKERKRLRDLPRYVKTETNIFGVHFYINDACTLLSDINEIVYGEIYKFKTNSPYPLIIDCGANIGVSIIFFKKLYPNSKIIAFEADPVLYDILSKNISNFSFEKVEIYNNAVWIKDSVVNFIVEGGHSGRITTQHGEKYNKNIISVKTISLKDKLDSFDSIDMLKMDIEGAEIDVLLDCGHLLNRCKHIFIEYHSCNNKKQDLHKILELLSSMGYRYHIKEAFSRKNPFVDKNCLVDMDMQLNVFFYKENV